MIKWTVYSHGRSVCQGTLSSNESRHTVVEGIGENGNGEGSTTH